MLPRSAQPPSTKLCSAWSHFPWHTPGQDTGFTLIEVIVVLVILGLAGGLVMARGSSRSAGLDLRLAGNAVSGALRLARTEAISRNTPVSVVFDQGTGTVRIGARPLLSLPAGVAMAVITTADSSAGAQAAISFLPDGSSTGGRVELAAGSRRVRVVVEWLTGRVAAEAQ